MPGIEADFVHPVQSSLECPICLQVLKRPVQISPCGHRMCEECLKDMLSRKGYRCPMDNLELNPTKVFDDNACHRQVMSLEVFCTRKTAGCNWQGCLSDLQDHEKFCHFAVISCPRLCGQKCFRQDLVHHEKDCKLTITSCKHCKKEVLNRDYQTHLTSCSSVPQECPLKCGARYLTKGKLSEHIHNDCELLVIPCKFSDFGCDFKTERKAMSDHLSIKKEQHIEKLVREAARQKKVIEIQEEKLRTQTEILSRQSNVLESLREEMANLRLSRTNGEVICKVSEFHKKALHSNRVDGSVELMNEVFYTHTYGYQIVASVWIEGLGAWKTNYLVVGLQIKRGEYDAILKWPHKIKYTITLFDQNTNSQKRKDLILSAESNLTLMPVDDTSTRRNQLKIITLEDLKQSTYLHRDSLFLRFTVNNKHSTRKSLKS